MNEIKNLSRKSARPAMIATKNQKQTISLTIVSTEGGMYKGVCVQEVVLNFVLYSCIKNESYIKKYVMYVLYILIVMYLDPKASFKRVLYVVCTIEERTRKYYNYVI